MKYAIAAEGPEIDSQVSDRGGRAPYYLYFDEDKNLIKSIKNPFAVGGGGAGFSVAKMLENDEVGHLICGQIGPKMSAALAERKIEFSAFQGSVTEALNQFS